MSPSPRCAARIWGPRYLTVTTRECVSTAGKVCVCDGVSTGHCNAAAAQVKSELAVVDKTNATMQSFARVNFVDACEAAINEQIK